MDAQRFESFLMKDECWLWSRAKTTAGYGVFRDPATGKNAYAHQHAYRLWVSPNLPKVVRHKCRNRHCCNPDHLEGGTHKENNGIDKQRDGTDNKGERHGNSKLTAEQVVEMRRLRREGWSLEQLMARYELTSSAILHALSGKHWSHIPDPITEEEMKALRHHKKGKLTEEDKADIRHRASHGVKQTYLAKEYGVSQTTIRNILTPPW
jgi:lambda repressor-like predicted transcriptional regulator